MPDQSQDEPKSINTGLDITAAVIVFIIVLGFLAWFWAALNEWYGGFFEWIRSGKWRSILNGFAAVFSVINAFLLAFIVFIIYRINTMKPGTSETKTVAHTVLPKEEVSENWNHIRELANSSSPSDWNMAILRADALLDDILQHVGYEGATLAERLTIVDPTKVKSLDRVWSAHRLRNAIAHEPLEQHPKETIVYALRSYAEALKELGFME